MLRFIHAQGTVVRCEHTMGDVSASRGQALMPSCMTVNEFTLYSALFIPAGLELVLLTAHTDAAICSAPSARLPHPVLLNPDRLGCGVAHTMRPLFLGCTASDLLLWAVG